MYRIGGFEYFVHLLSRSLMFSYLLVSKLCCGNITLHAADLIPNCAKHWLVTSKCLLSVSHPIFFYSLIRSLFLKRTKHCVFTGKCNLWASRPIFFYSLIRNLFQTEKHCVFTGKCCMCLSSHFFLFPNAQLIPTCAKHGVFTGRCVCLSRPIFSYSLIHD